MYCELQFGFVCYFGVFGFSGFLGFWGLDFWVWVLGFLGFDYFEWLLFCCDLLVRFCFADLGFSVWDLGLLFC